MRTGVWDVDDEVAVPALRPLRRNLQDAVAGPRFNLQWMGFFALAALGMASMGVFAVIGYSVARRTREIGIRLALGAAPGSAVRMVLSGGVRLILGGVALGALGAVVLSRYLESMIFQSAALHPAIFGLVALILVAVATVASYVPARRATRVDPMIALRAD